jgi:hypothetical protein
MPSILFPLVLAIQAATDSGPVFDGRARQLRVLIPRIEEAVQVDGVLDEAVWARAARLTGFSQYQPVDSRPAEERTEIFVWYGPTAIYFGIRAYEPHGDVVRATRADRDNIGSDDQVQILLDTYNDRRRAFLFGVNPFGVQQDGIRSDQYSGGAGGTFTGGGGVGGMNILDGNVDLNPDFVFESRGRLTPWGYEVEVRIPFKSLRYQDGNPQDWGINVLRRTQHSGYQDSWTPVVRASASFLNQSGRLEGLHDLRRGLVLEATPTATSRLTGRQGASGWRYRDTTELGLSVRYGLTPNLSLDGTINPDFSQVEADVGQVTINERFALYFPEKRPFFLEGLELFDSPNQLIYTRQIVNPGFGAKLAGKLGATNIGTLVAQDASSQSLTGSRPLFGVVRLRSDLGRSSSVGVVATAREDGADHSRLVGTDVRIVHSRLYFVELQAVQAATDSAGHRFSGPLLAATWDRTGRAYGFNYSVKGIAPTFRAKAGFVNRVGVVEAHAYNRFTVYGRRGALVEQVSTFVNANRTWTWDAFDLSRGLEGGISVSSGATLRGGWSVNLNGSRSFYRFEDARYAAYAVTSGLDTVAFAPPDAVRGLASGGLSASTPAFRTFSASVSASAGSAAIFPEAARGRQTRFSSTLNWRPTGQVRVAGQYVRNILNRSRDGSRFSTEDIPRLKVEYQAGRSIFVRFVGQYAARRRDALRDPLAERPLLVGGVPSGAFSTNQINVDWLFSYRPGPGTLIYLGYGSTLTEDGAFAFGRDVQRTADGFFAKVSYLFRM